MIYARCINCSYINVAKGIRLLDKKNNSCLYRRIFMQVRTFERYISLSGHSKIDKTKILKTTGSLMKVESIAECSLGAFCNTYDLYKR